MKDKKVCYSELAYLIGIIVLAFGTAFMERADFGISMVVAPAYLLHLNISQYLPFFSFGMAEYVFQLFVLILLALCMRKFKVSYLFSFVTAVIYGFALDLAIAAVAFLPGFGMAGRFAYYLVGLVFCSIGVSFLFHTYLAPEAYELFVKELSRRFGWDIHKTKTAYDFCSCLIGILLSFAFFGLWQFEGVKLGTIVCAAVNGFLIGKISGCLEKIFVFQDRFSWRKAFEI